MIAGISIPYHFHYNINFILMKRPVSPFIALRFPDFRSMWIGLFISAIGSQMQIVGVTWHVYELTHSAFSLGFIGLSRFVPLLLVSPFGGLIADAFDRKKIIIINQLVMSVSAFLLFVATFTNLVSPLFIYFILAINSVCSSIDIPARHALTPHLLPRKYFMNAISLNSLMWQASIVIGPAIAGFAIAYLGVGSLYLVNSLSYLAVVVSVLLIRFTPELEGKSSTISLSALKEGFVFVFKHPLISSSMIIDFFATFFSSATTLLPIFAKDILNVGPQGLGLLYAASSVGAIFAGLLFSSFPHVRHQGKILIVSVFIYGITTIFFGLSRLFIFSFVFLALSGATDMISTVIRNTLRQLNTPDRLRGRMTSINSLFYNGGPQLGEVEAGGVAGFFGAPVSVVIGGIGTIIVTALIAFFVPKLRKYHGDEVII